MDGYCCSTSSHCCDKPNLLPMLVRLGVALLFITTGVMKVVDPEMCRGMLAQSIGLSGVMIGISYWLVVVFEALGGLFVLLGKLIPRVLYKLSLLGQFVIIAVAIVTVVLPGGNTIMLLFNLLLVLNIVGLYFSFPNCCCGITGSNDCCKE